MERWRNHPVKFDSVQLIPSGDSIYMHPWLSQPDIGGIPTISMQKCTGDEYRTANHYNFCGIITIFCFSLCLYSENYDKSAFSRNSSIWYSSDNVLAAHCITQLVFRGLYRACCLFSTASVLLTTRQLL